MTTRKRKRDPEMGALRSVFLCRDLVLQLCLWLDDLDSTRFLRCDKGLYTTREGYRYKREYDWVCVPKNCRKNITMARMDTLDKTLRDAIRLTSLRMVSWFNQPIDRVTWPTSLTALHMGHYFMQPIDRVTWPISLTSLHMGNWFDQPIDRVTWPASLTSLGMGDWFNRPIDRVTWPTSLKFLHLGYKFLQPIDFSILPNSVTAVGYGNHTHFLR